MYDLLGELTVILIII